MFALILLLDMHNVASSRSLQIAGQWTGHNLAQFNALVSSTYDHNDMDTPIERNCCLSESTPKLQQLQNNDSLRGRSRLTVQGGQSKVVKMQENDSILTSLSSASTGGSLFTFQSEILQADLISKKNQGSKVKGFAIMWVIVFIPQNS